MVQKRPFVEELSDVSSKHLRLEHGSQLVSFLEFPFHDVSQDPYTSDGKSCFSKRTTESDVKLESGKNIDFSMYTEKDIDILPGNNSNSSWPSNCENEEEMRSEAGHILFSQEYCSPARPRRTIVQPEDAYSYLLQRPPLKLVSVGPDFQADVPEWCGHGAKTVSICSDFTEASTTSQASELNFKSTVEDEIKLVGHCIIPMPEIEPVSCNSDEVGSGRTDCFCKDPGSLRCVRQHIREARVNLWRTVGLERFLELGFGGMGEIVADKWSDEDEQLFHDVVFSNPASLGKNFWDRLAIVFPSRTSDEIVSYYFNVFMLRKRAEQNRCTPMDIDSDNDEWEGSDESDEDEDPYQSEIHEDDSFDHIEGVEKAVFDYHDKIDYCGFKGMKNVSETWPMTLLNNSSSDSSPKPLEKTPEDEMGAYDFQDDSCTTFDAVAVPQVSELKVGDNKHWGSHEFILEPCDAKVWDAGYLTCPRTKADFLPTYSMIEEVFGVEAWEHEARDDGKSLS